VRVGVIGAGWIAEKHVPILRGIDGVDLVAVCDLDESRAQALAGDGAVFTDWRALLDETAPDCVWVCTPPRFHREPTVEALERGIHVYLEKPIARDLDDARAIVRVAEDASAVCAVGYQWRAVEVLDDLREAIEGQQLGLLIGIGTGPTKSRPWFLDRAAGGGNILERASHGIDLERAVAGEVAAVQATASAVPLAQSAGGEQGDIEDAAAISLRFENGAVGTATIAWTRDGLPDTYTLDVHASDSSLHLELDPSFTLSGVSAGKTIEAATSMHPLERGVRRFLEAAAGGTEPVFCTPRQAAGTLATVLACEEALSTGGTVAVESI
jgi:myo-inositol 2-dehydrogenase / D-chiro-inositol 1-dehydrogenase